MFCGRWDRQGNLVVVDKAGHRGHASYEGCRQAMVQEAEEQLQRIEAGVRYPPESSFTCPRCGAVSRLPEDLAQGYCGRCHDWTGSAAPRERLG